MGRKYDAKVVKYFIIRFLIAAGKTCSDLDKTIYWWAGWGSGLDPHTLVKMVPAVLRAA